MPELRSSSKRTDKPVGSTRGFGREAMPPASTSAGAVPRIGATGAQAVRNAPPAPAQAADRKPAASQPPPAGSLPRKDGRNGCKKVGLAEESNRTARRKTASQETESRKGTEGMKEKTLKRIFLAGYLAVILFCMFFGFGRMARFDSFQFSFAVTGIPLWFPHHFSSDILQIWVFSLGNLVAFIPFGALIPLNLQTTRKLLLKSLAIFVAGITVLETLQMLTLLGSFDAEDILVNTLGFLIGYASWSFSRREGRPSRKILRFCIACIALAAVAIIGAELANPLLR